MQTTPVTILTNEQLGPAVSGRELMGLIHVSNANRDTFSQWFKDRIALLDLTDGVDYLRGTVNLAGYHRPMTEYIASVPVAIKIAEYQSGKRGLPVARFLQAYQQNPTLATSTVEPTQALTPEIRATIEQPATNSETTISGFDAANNLTSPNGYRFEQTAGAAPAEPTRPKTQAEQLLEQAQHLVEEERKRASEPPTVPVDNETTLQRINAVESKLNAIVGIVQQAATSLAGLLPVEQPAADPQAPPTTRALLTRLVNSYAAAERKTEHETWRYLYGQFDLRAGVNAYAQAAGRTGGQSYLAVIESGGQIEDLYALAKKLLVLPALH